MGGYTKVNLKEIEAGGTGEVEARFARKHLDSDHLGVSLFRYGSGYRSRTGHSHREQEEVYVVVGGSGRVKLDDEVVELRPWDAVRVAPSTVRAFEGGPDGKKDGQKDGNWWGKTVGDAQYNWFQQTLEQSQAKYKFVFAHHVLGWHPHVVQH